MSGGVSLEGVSVRLGGRDVLRDVELDVEAGGFLTLLGPSGAGKTTALGVVAGFVAARTGTVRIDGADVAGIPIERRDVAVVFQGYALFPHLSVAENVEFPLRARRVEAAERRRRSDAALALVRLDGFGRRRVAELSGGERQRVALARALVFRPRALLLDEPLGALDPGLRQGMQLELKRIQADVGVTTIAVTHDQSEALSMSDRVAVLRDGAVEQVGTPRELYSRPASAFVATFVGESNLVPVDAGHLDGFGLRLPEAPDGVAVLRPEALGIRELGDPGTGAWAGRVTGLSYQGPRQRLVATGADGSTLVVAVATLTDDATLRPGRPVTVVCREPARIHVIPR